MQDTIEPVKILLTKLFERLQLKEKAFKTFAPASEDDMKIMWDCLELFGDPLDRTDMKQAQLNRSVQQRPELKAFLEHCTTSRSYFLCIKTCGDQSCTICKEPNLPPDVFQQLHRFPDPVPGEDGHYKCFEDVFGTDTTEEHRPSLKKNVSSSQGHKIPFSPSAQTAKTAKSIVKCSDCEKPRVVYSATKLSNEESELLHRIISLYDYSCGSSLQDLKTEDNSTPRVNKLLDKCFVRRNLTCLLPLEVPYFSSACFRELCFHCGKEDNLTRDIGAYPVCTDCTSKSVPLKRKHAMTAEHGKKKKQ